MLLVFSGPVDGREDDYNEWYDNTHLKEVLQVPGFTAAQRYKANDNAGLPASPHPYVAIYEIEGDPAAAMKGLFGAFSSMTMSDAMDSAKGSLMVFSPCTERRTS